MRWKNASVEDLEKHEQPFQFVNSLLHNIISGYKELDEGGFAPGGVPFVCGIYLTAGKRTLLHC